MKATIDLKGMLHIYAETELEGYALDVWFNNSLENENNMENVSFHIDPDVPGEKNVKG